MAGIKEETGSFEGPAKTFRLIVSNSAEVEIQEAYDWIELNQPGNGIHFKDSLDNCLARILKSPLTYRKKFLNARSIVMRPFKYRIFYFLNKSEISVIALVHSSRHDRVWKSRIRGNS